MSNKSIPMKIFEGKGWIVRGRLEKKMSENSYPLSYLNSMIFMSLSLCAFK